MRVPVYEVPLSYYAKMTVKASLPEDIIDLQKKWFLRRCAKELDLVITFAPQPVLNRLLRESPRGEGLREFVFSAKNITPGAEIAMALVPRGTNTPDQRLTARYPGEVFFMEVLSSGWEVPPGGGNVELRRHEFRRTGIDLLTGDHIYREQEEA